MKLSQHQRRDEKGISFRVCRGYPPRKYAVACQGNAESPNLTSFAKAFQPFPVLRALPCPPCSVGTHPSEPSTSRLSASSSLLSGSTPDFGDTLLVGLRDAFLRGTPPPPLISLCSLGLCGKYFSGQKKRGGSPSSVRAEESLLKR